MLTYSASFLSYYLHGVDSWNRLELNMKKKSALSSWLWINFWEKSERLLLTLIALLWNVSLELKNPKLVKFTKNENSGNTKVWKHANIYFESDTRILNICLTWNNHQNYYSYWMLFYSIEHLNRVIPHQTLFYGCKVKKRLRKISCHFQEVKSFLNKLTTIQTIHKL